MAEEEKKKGFWKKAWEVFQTVGAGAGIIAAQHAIEEALSNAGKKAGEHVGRKIGEAFGLSSEAAEKTDDDEISFEKLLVSGNLTPDQKKDIKAWLGKLRESDPKLASEFTRRIHNTMVKFRVKISPAKKKGGNQPPKESTAEETVSFDYVDAINVAENIILDILSTSDEAERLRILERRNIKVAPKKPAPAADAAKKAFEWSKEKVAETVDAEKVNRQDFNDTMASWRERSQTWRNSR